MYNFKSALRSLDLLLHETGIAADEACRFQENQDIDRILGDQPTFPFLFQVGILVPEQATFRDRD